MKNYINLKVLFCILLFSFISSCSQVEKLFGSKNEKKQPTTYRSKINSIENSGIWMDSDSLKTNQGSKVILSIFHAYANGPKTLLGFFPEVLEKYKASLAILAPVGPYKVPGVATQFAESSTAQEKASSIPNAPFTITKKGETWEFINQACDFGKKNPSFFEYHLPDFPENINEALTKIDHIDINEDDEGMFASLGSVKKNPSRGAVANSKKILNFLRKNKTNLSPLLSCYPHLFGKLDKDELTDLDVEDSTDDKKRNDSKIGKVLIDLSRLIKFLAKRPFKNNVNLAPINYEQVRHAAREIVAQNRDLKNQLKNEKSLDLSMGPAVGYSQGGAMAIATALLYPKEINTVLAMAPKIDTDFIKNLNLVGSTTDRKDTTIIMAFKKEDVVAPAGQIEEIKNSLINAGINESNIIVLQYPGTHETINSTDENLAKTFVEEIANSRNPKNKIKTQFQNLIVN